MNVFERGDGNRKRRGNGRVTAWTCFEASIRDLLNSYNNSHSKGQLHPAKIVESKDTLIVIECNLGPSPKEDFSTLMLTVTANMVREEFLIEARLERWLLRLPGAPSKSDSSESFRFTLELADGDAVLSHKGQPYSPYQAAELLLETALLK